MSRPFDPSVPGSTPGGAAAGRCARRRARWAPLAVVVGLAGLAACQAQTTPPAQTIPRDGLQAEAAVLARIRAEVGEARCERDADCRTLPLGEKACGGPAGWLAWSVHQGRADRLGAWSAELAALQRDRQARDGLVSNCQYLPDPGARCVAQRCVLQGRDAAAR